jgi:putative mRNA 3-end processing factor
MKLTFHGGALEVGRSCVSLDDEYLFDAGLKISEEGSEYPVISDLSRIRTVFLSHGHLDHCGALPLFNKNGLRATICCTGLTKDTTKILLKDSFHVETLQNHVAGYSRENIYNVLSSMQIVHYDKEYTFGSMRYKFLNAGHIPGSASILVTSKGKSVLYTGDINTVDTRLVRGLTYRMKVDTLICETTYGDRDHPPRQEVEEAFLNRTEEVLGRGGVVLIPAFSVGRSQEILMLLKSRGIQRPIYLDGMAKEVTNLFLRKPGALHQHAALAAAVKDVKFIKNPRQRKDLVHSPCVIVTTSGMLDGGPVIDYLRLLYRSENAAILLTGFQTEESNGRLLMDTRKVYVDGIRVKVIGTVEKFDFSAHAGRQELIRFIDGMDPKNLVLQHGDPSAIKSLAEYYHGKRTVYTPRIGESISV